MSSPVAMWGPAGEKRELLPRVAFPRVSGALPKPGAVVLVEKNHDVLAGLENELEVATPYGLGCPPAVRDTPFLP